MLSCFDAHFGLRPHADPRRRLGDIARAFANLPYENLTKIIKEASTDQPHEARRLPAEVLSDHARLGAGGTCFSLTALLLHLVRTLGHRAEPILADRRYGPDTHCALLVWLDGTPHLIDPGYLILDPVELPSDQPVVLRTRFNQIVLRPADGGRRVDLCTPQGKRTEGCGFARQNVRLTFKTEPADPPQFLCAWDASFDWEMMRYPVLSRVSDQGQHFLRGNLLQVRHHQSLTRSEIPPTALIARIGADFGIHPEVVGRALAVLHAKGEPHGQALGG